MAPDAMTVERPDHGFTLFLNSSQRRVRHRFSVAHELAHLILTPILGKRVVHRRRFSRNQDPFGAQIEYLCNDMASAILMPASEVKQILRDGGYSAKCVPQITESFGTSFEAAARRFVQLVNRPCGLVVWQSRSAEKVSYKRGTIWNQQLGYCELRFDQPPLTDVSVGFNASGTHPISSRESIIATTKRGRYDMRRAFRDISVESFRRRERNGDSFWSFVHFDRKLW